MWRTITSYVYQCATAFDPHWTTPFVAFTNEERQHLASIPYPLLPPVVTTEDDRATFRLLLGAVDILFAYVYDHLTTGGEPTVESAWTIAILSGSLSWLDDGWEANGGDVGGREDGEESAVERVIQSSVRRSLVYPCLRNLDLTLGCAKHVASILAGDPETMIRCFLQARAVLNKSDVHYLSNKLYVDPYVAWLQSSTTTWRLASTCARLSVQIESCVVPPHNWEAELNLPLFRLEDSPSEIEAPWGDDDVDGREGGALTDSSESDDSTADSSSSDSTNETDPEATSHHANESPPLARADCTPSSEGSDAMLPALEGLCLEDNPAPDSPVRLPPTPTRGSSRSLTDGWCQPNKGFGVDRPRILTAKESIGTTGALLQFLYVCKSVRTLL
jgi:SHQ1 protein